MRQLVTVIFSLMFPIASSAQFLVEADGDAAVGIVHDDDYPLLSQFSINTRGASSTLAFFNADSCLTGLNIDRTDTYFQNTNVRVGLNVNSTNSQYHDNYGIKVTASSSTSLGYGKSYGLWAKAGNAQDGYNYGVCASLIQGNYGAAIYGSCGNLPNGFQLTSSLAAYFDGNVQAGGVVVAPAFVNPSDYRLKSDIAGIDGALENVLDMNVIQYKLRPIEVATGDNDSVKHYKYDPESAVMKNLHYGLIAQDLQLLYPDLVQEGDDGYLSVNYMELIPILIKSIQELKAELDEVKDSANAQTKGNLQSEASDNMQYSSVLSQNAPNPFTESTVIECDIPVDVNTATLYIYDMNGSQLDNITISERGKTSVTIDGGSLAAGMYLYSLITDGNVVGTRRMILTK